MQVKTLVQIMNQSTQIESEEIMLKVEVKDTSVTTREGKNDNGPWKSRNQTAYAYTYNRNGALNPYPQEIQIRLEVGRGDNPDQSPFALGTYYIHPSCIYIGEYGSLRFGNIRLITEGEYRALTSNIKAAA